MRVDEAQALVAALQTAIAQAQAQGKDEIPAGVFAAVLDARLAAALADLRSAIDGP